jgi:hydroxypyruvate reductase
MNAVRKHLSAIKGGQLAALAYPATVLALLLSDVIGDDLDVIGSGPTAPDASTFSSAAGILRKYAIWDRVPASVRRRIQSGLRGEIEETPKKLARVQNLVVGSNRLAVDAAAARARALGFRTLILSTRIEGETAEVAGVHAAILRDCLENGYPLKPPACIISGGETTVSLGEASGLGGRNQEFALAAARLLDGVQGAAVFSAGTDGTDGPTDAAGAFADSTTVRRAEKLGLSAEDFLARHDSYPFFERLGDLVKTGPTGTNVADVRLLLAVRKT